MVVNLVIVIGCRKVKEKDDADMWNNLCVLLVANNVKCCIVDGYEFQHCDCVSTQIMIWQGRTFRQGIGYSGYSFACGGRIVLREFRNS